MAADRTSDHPQGPGSERPLAAGEVGSGLDPDEIGRKTFETAFRGFEPGQVQAYLLTVASELRAIREHAFDLELRLAEAERVAEQASVIDDDRLTAALGDEVATILEAARSAASKMRAQAEIDATARVRAGEEQAARVRREADGLLEHKTVEAREAAAAIEQEAEAMRVQAGLDAAAEVEAGKQAGREMVAEAQVVRERILKDLARRRRQARQQIEQLRAGRERLLEAYRVVRETMERATEELEISLPAAKAAAETAGRSVPDDDEDLSVEQLEGMLDAARDAGLIDARAAEVEAEIEADTAADDHEVERVDGADGADDRPAPPHDHEAEAPDEPETEVAAETEVPASDAPVRSHRRSRRAQRIVADEPAPPPVEGRRSSSVRVFRRDGDPSAPDSGDESAVEGSVGETSADESESAAVIELPVGRNAHDDPSDPDDDTEIVVEIIEEIIEVDELADGEAEIVVIEEVVEMVVDAEPGDETVEGEVITGLFARIRADHAEPSTPDTPAVTDAGEPAAGERDRSTRAKGNGNGNGKRATRASSSSRSKAPKTDAKAKAGADKAPTTSAKAKTDKTAGAQTGAKPDADPTVDEAGSESPQDRRDLALAGPSRGLGRALKRVVADEQNEVLDVVRREKKVPAIDAVLPEPSEHALRYAAAARGELADAAYAGATFADEATSERPDIDDLAAELSLAIVSQLRAGFEGALAASPDDRDALLDALRAVYRDAKSQRVDDCVRHFAGESFNRGVRAASSSGLDVRMLVDAGTKPPLT